MEATRKKILYDIPETVPGIPTFPKARHQLTVSLAFGRLPPMSITQLEHKFGDIVILIDIVGNYLSRYQFTGSKQQSSSKTIE